MINKEAKPAGYIYLIERYKLNVVPHYRASYVTTRGQRRVEHINGIEKVVYPKSYIPEDTFVAQLVFALKYDGVNFEILKATFNAIVEARKITEFRQYILDHPTSKYTRKLWYLYEYLLDAHLSIPGVCKGSYVDLLDSKKYFTCKSIKSQRHRVNNNLLGNRNYCPVVRRSTVIENFISKKLQNQAQDVVAQYSGEVVDTANQYLNIKEAKSTFDIEGENQSKIRMNRFIDSLKKVGPSTEITKEKLIELQNMIVDERFMELDYRATQSYVGEMLGGHREKIRYIAPCPDDVPSCMEGLLENMKRMENSDVDFVVQAAVIAFGFVFIRPFESGNGRIHRLLIHHILSKTDLIPQKFIFPISSVMLAEQDNYNECLEVFSQKLMLLIDYKLKKNGALVVGAETVDHYRYYDATKIVEYVFDVIEKTIQEDFISELDFVVAYNKTKVDFRNIVDMPDNLIVEFIKTGLDKNKKLSKLKYNRLFSKAEITQLEEIIDRNFSYKNKLL